MRDQLNAIVSGTTSAINQPVLLGLRDSNSAMTKHSPARVGTTALRLHMQWLAFRRQTAHRDWRGILRSRPGRVLLWARQAARKVDTAWDMPAV